MCRITLTSLSMLICSLFLFHHRVCAEGTTEDIEKQLLTIIGFDPGFDKNRRNELLIKTAQGHEQMLAELIRQKSAATALPALEALDSNLAEEVVLEMLPKVKGMNPSYRNSGYISEVLMSAARQGLEIQPLLLELMEKGRHIEELPEKWSESDSVGRELDRAFRAAIALLRTGDKKQKNEAADFLLNKGELNLRDGDTAYTSLLVGMAYVLHFDLESGEVASAFLVNEIVTSERIDEEVFRSLPRDIKNNELIQALYHRVDKALGEYETESLSSIFAGLEALSEMQHAKPFIAEGFWQKQWNMLKGSFYARINMPPLPGESMEDRHSARLDALIERVGIVTDESPANEQ